MDEELIRPQLGMMLYGYCQGYFGRDGYDDKRIEVVAYDYIVVRTDAGTDILNTKDWGGKIPKQWLEAESEDY